MEIKLEQHRDTGPTVSIQCECGESEEWTLKEFLGFELGLDLRECRDALVPTDEEVVRQVKDTCDEYVDYMDPSDVFDIMVNAGYEQCIECETWRELDQVRVDGKTVPCLSCRNEE